MSLDGNRRCTRGSTGVADGRVDRPVDDGRGGVVKGASLLLGPFPVVMTEKLGSSCQTGPPPAV